MKRWIRMVFSVLSLCMLICLISPRALAQTAETKEAPAAAAPEQPAPAQPQAAPEETRKETFIGQEAKAPTFDEKVKQIKNPVPWLKWGFDQRLRQIYANNFITLDKEATGHERVFSRLRSRLWAQFLPAENVEINTRLLWEWRIWCSSNDGGPLSNPSSIEWDEAAFDTLNVNLKNVADQPFDLKIGRQDIIFGNGWLVLDGTPLDGSRSIYFDAIRGTYHLKDAKTDIDMIYIDQKEQADQYIEPFNDQQRGLREQDERGAILYFTNKSIENTQLDGYYMWKHDMRPDVRPGANNFPPSWTRESDIHAVGARGVFDLSKNWNYRAEFAQEMGRQMGEPLCAFGFNSKLTYKFLDKYNNSLGTGYEYLSGDDPSTDTDEGFDPLWARWPQWSELYVYTYIPETRIAETTNLHRVPFTWEFDPCKKIHFCNEYNLLFRDEDVNRAGYSEGPFRGQLLTSRMTYKFNPYISGHLLGEFFFPGNFYSDQKNDVAMFLRYELMITF